MLIREILNDDENGIDYFVLEIDESLIPQKILINEGKWMPSGKKDFMQRIDAANPSMKQLRHVHIAHAKHVNTKNMQVAWNADGTKHDKNSFNTKIGSLNVVQDIARQALHLSADVKLEEASMAKKVLRLMQVNESLDFGKLTPPLFVTISS